MLLDKTLKVFFCSEVDEKCDLPHGGDVRTKRKKKKKKPCHGHCTLCFVENLRALREVLLLGHSSQGQMAAIDG